MDIIAKIVLWIMTGLLTTVVGLIVYIHKNNVRRMDRMETRIVKMDIKWHNFARSIFTLTAKLHPSDGPEVVSAFAEATKENGNGLLH